MKENQLAGWNVLITSAPGGFVATLREGTGPGEIITEGKTPLRALLGMTRRLAYHPIPAEAWAAIEAHTDAYSITEKF